MELTGFRELLLKKAADANPYLKEFIAHSKDELIIERIMESLEKMARPSSAMGRGANSAITAYASQMGAGDVAQLKDALTHHISQYRGALKSGNREVADQHLSKIIPLMHLAGRASKHSDGKLALDYRSTTPWETNYTRTDRHEHNGKLKEGTKDLGRRPKKTREGNQYGVPDYRYLEMAPHAGHSDTAGIPTKESGYPFEETQVGSSQDIDNGKGHLHLYDPGEVTEYKPHPFDHHPVHELADSPEHELTPEHKEKFVNDLKEWRNSDHHKNWMASQKEAFAKDPEGYKARGTVKPGHFWDGLKLGEQPDHAKAKPADAQAAPAPVAEAPTEAPAKVEAKPASKKKIHDPAIHNYLMDHSKADEIANMHPIAVKSFANYASQHMGPEDHAQMHPTTRQKLGV